MGTGAVIFDLDGTLIDSRGSIAAACNHALGSAGRAPLPESTLAGYVGDGSRNLVARALGAGATEREVDAVLTEFLRYYEAHPAERTAWMPHARAALEALDEWPLGLVTNKARRVTVRVLEAMGMAKYFRIVVAGGDGPLKPDPAPVHAALRGMDARADLSWVVGDGVQDVLAGRAAGCRTAAVLEGFTTETRLRAAGPDVVLASLAEITLIF